MKRTLVPLQAATPAVMHRCLWAGLALAGLAGCAERLPLRTFDANAQLRSDIASRPPPPPAAASVTPPPPAPPVAAAPAPVPAEPRFDLIVNGANARDVFLGMVADTRYSMLMHPDVAGVLSVTLRGVTVREALESIRDVYGYDFKIEGRRVTVYPPTMQTRLFTVNYLHNKRQGKSEVRVAGSGAPTNSVSGMGVTGGSTTVTSTTPDSSQISTSTSTDIWSETAEALRALIGINGGANGAAGNGRAVITSPQAGTIAVRAMPDELRQVEKFLKASKLAVERQVMLEAKIVEVELREGFQSGIDWSLMRGNGLGGQTSGYPNNPLLGNTAGKPTLPDVATALIGDIVGLPPGTGGTLGLSFADRGFQMVLGFLESHGSTQVLSSPRVATLNNQKAVLKVGTDEYFVTNVSGGSVTPGNNATNGTTSLPTVTLTPFFSGIALDVTPQIDEGGMITLHLRPSVTAVTEKVKRIDLGQIGNYQLPLASSRVNETDTVVRVPDGHIVAIGGLMQMESTRSNSGFPGANGNDFTRTLLSNTADTGRKKELVVLIRPTVIRNNEDWERTTQESIMALEDSTGPRRVVTVSAPPGTPAAASSAAPANASAATPTPTPASAAEPAPGPAAGPQTIAAAQRR